MIVHLVLDPPEGDEDAGVAEHDHQVGQAGHKGPVEVGECLSPIVIYYRAGPLIILLCRMRCLIILHLLFIRIPVFSMYPSSPQIPTAGSSMRTNGIKHPNKVRTIVRGIFNLEIMTVSHFTQVSSRLYCLHTVRYLLTARMACTIRMQPMWT